jgi:hypothetical protein
MAHLVRHALNHGNVFEGPLTDRIADAGNRGCQGQVATHNGRSFRSTATTAHAPFPPLPTRPWEARLVNMGRIDTKAKLGDDKVRRAANEYFNSMGRSTRTIARLQLPPEVPKAQFSPWSDPATGTREGFRKGAPLAACCACATAERFRLSQPNRGGLESTPQRTLELACHLWYHIYLALCADADGNVSLLRAHKLSWAVAPGAGRVPIAIGLGP